MSYISPSEEEQRLLSSSVNSGAVLRMMGGGARGSAPPIRGRGTSIGPDRGRGRGKFFGKCILPTDMTTAGGVNYGNIYEHYGKLLNTNYLQGEDVEMGGFTETLMKTVLEVSDMAGDLRGEKKGEFVADLRIETELWHLHFY